MMVSQGSSLSASSTSQDPTAAVIRSTKSSHRLDVVDNLKICSAEECSTYTSYSRPAGQAAS
jgi:hypothetical protein